MKLRVNSRGLHTRTALCLIGLLWLLAVPLAGQEYKDEDGDGVPAWYDCDDNNPDWNENCWLKAFTGCTNENRFDLVCLPNISAVEEKLNTLHEDLVGMSKDKHTWKGAVSRPGDNLPYDGSKRHVQSIQYWDYEGQRYIITSISDEEDNLAAIQIVKTFDFGLEGSETDEIVQQYPLPLAGAAWSRFNHPGGSQLIGDFLFIALEDFSTDPPGKPATGIFWMAGENIIPLFLVETKVETGDVTQDFKDDYHQSTAAVTKLADGSHLLAACVGPEGCNNLNFYRSNGEDFLSVTKLRFDYVDTWNRNDISPLGLPDDGKNWDECPNGPQNMNFVPQDDGSLFLVMFGGVNRGTDGKLSGCVTGLGYDDHLFVYKVRMDEDEEIYLEYKNKVDVMPDRHICGTGAFPSILVPDLHGLNFMAGSGLWLSPDGNGEIAILATEHYDSCGATVRGVNAKTRWGVSGNWSNTSLITVDQSEVTAYEGGTAVNSGGFFDLLDDLTLSASVGAIAPDPENWGNWNWDWKTTDGPDDSQKVEITLQARLLGYKLPPKTATFDLVVNNLPPTATAGVDQVVECVAGEPVSLDASGSSDPGADSLTFAWEFESFPGADEPSFDDSTSTTPSFHPGEFGKYTAKVMVTDDDGASDTDIVTVTFQDTIAPVVNSVIAQPDTLWPPNGKLVEVDVTVSVTDACDVAPACSISSVESSEDDVKSPDIEFTDALTLRLRAERLGKKTGRVYMITVTCEDAAGNSADGSAIVSVPHDRGKD